MNFKNGGAIVTFSASSHLIAALDEAAKANGEERSLRIRKILAKSLRDAGHLSTNSPTTRREAKRLLRA